MPVVNTPHDPKLKKAMEEIKPILEKYGVGAAITLVSKTHSEYLYKLPKWSCVAITDRGFSIYSKKEDYDSVEHQHEIVETTTALIAQIRDLGGQTFMLFDGCLKELGEHFEILHVPFYKPEFAGESGAKRSDQDDAEKG